MSSFLAGLTMIGAVALLGWAVVVFVQDIAASRRSSNNQRT